ncbi:MAG: hypothetical protein RLZZ399_2343 [Verrucomicrobiota bacterium]|jgi:hypothetical protein
MNVEQGGEVRKRCDERGGEVKEGEGGAMNEKERRSAVKEGQSRRMNDGKWWTVICVTNPKG